MFRRLNPAEWEWQSVAAIIVFAFTFAVFVFFFIRAWRMKSEHADRMGRMPVDDGP